MSEEQPAIGSHLLGAPAAQEVPQKFRLREVQDYYLSGDEESLSEAGQALYASIRDRALANAEPTQVGSPTVYFTGGLPGSGKGQILDKMEANGGFVLIDPDHIKHDIMADLARKNPQLREAMQNDREWGTVVHWTSSLMAKQLMLDALETGADLVFDSSMSTPDQARYHEFASKARSQGYRVNALICDVRLEKSIERSEKRAQKPVEVEVEGADSLKLPGRLVTADYIRECQTRLEHNLFSFRMAGLFDSMSFYDNNSDGAPARLMSDIRPDTKGL
jgi:predicted kinase